MICVEDIDRNLAARGCDNPIVKGLYSEGWLFRKKYFVMSRSNYSTDYGKLLNECFVRWGFKPANEGQEEKASKIIVPSRTPFAGTKTEFSPGTYENTFTKTVSFVLLNQGPVVAQKMIAPLAEFDDWVIILHKRDVGENKSVHAGTLEVYGFEQGLKLTEAASEPWSDETLGGWQVTMQETGAIYPGVYFCGDASGQEERAWISELNKYSYQQ